MSYECDICGKTFANASNLLRHKKVVHAYGTRNLGQQTLTVNGVTVMQHPFTCIVAGCTQSGKTVWVKSLLENAQTTISRTPQRIIWCYGQWQPSYFDMIRLGFVVYVCKEVMGSEVFSRVLRDMLFLYSNKVL